MLKTFKLLVIIATSLWANTGYATNNSEAWVLTNLTGEVMLTKAGNVSKLAKLGDLFAPGDRLITPADGTAAVTRNAEAMIISSDSELELPLAGNTKVFTTILQNKGTILFSAKKKNERHFEIKTPFSAAIVKGTTFAISVNEENSQIQVFEGIVGLKAKGRKKSHDITTGFKSYVSKDIKQKIVISKALNAPKINPHLGSDIEKLAKTYLKKIKLRSQKKHVFKLKAAKLVKATQAENPAQVENPTQAEPKNQLALRFSKKLAKLDTKLLLKKLGLAEAIEQGKDVKKIKQAIKALKSKKITQFKKIEKTSKAVKAKRLEKAKKAKQVKLAKKARRLEKAKKAKQAEMARKAKRLEKARKAKILERAKRLAIAEKIRQKREIRKNKQNN